MNDPEVFLSACVAILSRYDQDIIDEVTGLNGLITKQKWHPTPFELREECDRLNAVKRQKEYRADQLREQFRLRDEMERGRTMTAQTVVKDAPLP